MKFSTFEKAVSGPRIARYLSAVGGRQQKAMYLYRLNLRLSQQFYALSSLFEVALRNEVDRHYSAQFSDPDWLINQCTVNGMFSYPALGRSSFRSRKIILDAYAALKNKYDHNSLLSNLNFGMWCYLFAPMQYRAGGQTLLKILTARPQGVNTTMVFNDLERIRFFRNRVAHQEPIIFDSIGVNANAAENAFENLYEKTLWLGFPPERLFKGLDYSKQILTLVKAV
ncbi:MAG: Abi family protein [Lewinellaceae bacterium]|nr:Abi family protein [Lewinellaceae bacterium]